MATATSITLARRYLLLGGVSLLVGGGEALVLRTQLMQPGMTWLEGAAFPGMLALHAFTMVLLALVPAQLGLVLLWLPRSCGLGDPALPRLARAGFHLHLAGALALYLAVGLGLAAGLGAEALPAPRWLGGLDATGLAPFELLDPMTPALLLVSLGVACSSISVLATLRALSAANPLAVTAGAAALLWLPVFGLTAASLGAAVVRELTGVGQTPGRPIWWRVFALFEAPGAWGLVLPSLGIAVHAMRPPGARSGEAPVPGFAGVAIALFLLAGLAGALGSGGYGQVQQLHLTFLAAALFAVFAGVYRAWPSLAGREPDPRLGRAHLWLQSICCLAMLAPTAWLAAQGAARRIPVVPPGPASELAHMAVSLSSFALGGAVLAGIALVLLRAPRR